jgi:hypothetical protein
MGDELECEKKRDENRLHALRGEPLNMHADYAKYEIRETKIYDRDIVNKLRLDETDGWNHWEYMNCINRNIELTDMLKSIREDRQKSAKQKNSDKKEVDTEIEKNNGHMRENETYLKSIFTLIDGKVRYKKITSGHYGLCKELKGIELKYVKIKFGVNLENHKFVIFRWGKWRVFDPMSMIIKVEPERVRDIEMGTNPITERNYTQKPSKYHTVLNNIVAIEPLYYSISNFTFYRLNGNNCEPKTKYRKSFPPSEKIIDCDEIKKFENNSNISMFVVKHIIQGGKIGGFLDYFVREFDGITDEIRGYGGFIGFGKTYHNLMEEAILSDGALDRLYRITYNE